MLLSSVGILCVQNNRTRAYLQGLHSIGLAPQHVILMKNPGNTTTPGQQKHDIAASRKSNGQELPHPWFHPNEDFESLLTTTGASITTLLTVDPNSPLVVAALQERPEVTWIVSLPGGAILQNEILGIGKQFLHVHPGKLPEYRGSTTIYYSILNEQKVGASALFLSREIDRGDVLGIQEFPLPKDGTSIDYWYDPLVRAELLMSTLRDYVSRGTFTPMPQPTHEPAYFIVHPVLKHLAILSVDEGNL